MHLLALIEARGHVCSRYRIAAFEPWLKFFNVKITYQAIEKSPLARLRQMQQAKDFDGVILQRRLLDPLSFRALRKAANHLVFDFDDAVLFRDSYAARGHHCPRRQARFASTVAAADMILAGNSFLATLAEQHGAPSANIHYMPTCIDLAAYEKIRAARKPRTDDRIVMAWIGSSSTLKGIEAASPIWNRIGLSVPKATLRVVCDRFPTFDHLPVEPVVWSESTEIKNIVSADIGISHVPDDLWSRGKCGLKVLQYLAAGLPVLTNPVGVHGEMIQSGKNGFLVDKNEEWHEAVRWFDRNRDCLAEMGEAGIETVRQGYDIADWGPFFVDRVAPGAIPADFDTRQLKSVEDFTHVADTGSRNWKRDTADLPGQMSPAPARLRSPQA
ncbi:MAG: glycosyltransferase family 4 protein [bacterium]